MSLRRTLIRPLPLLALALWGLAPRGAASADIMVTYDVDINTTSIQNSQGYLDFTFNPANGSAVFATADVANFSTNGTVGSQVFQSGDATGPSTGPLTSLSFDNGTGNNELTYVFTYGTNVSFDVTVSQATAGGSGSTFAFTLFDTNGDAYSTSPLGATATVTINPDGSTTGTAYLPFDDVTGTVTPAVSSVPEPSTLVLAGLGIAGLLGWSQVRRRLAAGGPGVRLVPLQA